ncbi:MULTISPECIES: TetR/AcrR family transcriptional regulator [unclassified Paraburkholderia]|uniref:TetR/AcrR family transcriptional regulator n=1 Tax=unclassified Paraburkholderia TaxID=2615204 RepID=UPI00160A8A69|nr:MULTISPECIES: TetR/AcrR family transcriptional regulator [unclassified Paraburkholderia]MBB5448027.1 TetR/AcrR family transcriptional repressor of nem operon [Paraburkholderia sp. WSM4177]MBB5488430.1 TetR/AcrR family transcriptional repressor of nem operon [Paraburkholderia sp. WSM4180]
MSHSKQAAKKAGETCQRGRPREFDTATVLANASQVFWDHGYHATSIDDLCKATGLLRGSLYGVFGDKHGIMLAALDHYSEGAVARLAQRLSATVEPEQALRDALLHYARVSCALSGRRSCFITNTTLEMQPDDEVLRARVAAIQRRMATLLAAAVIRGQASGAFDSTLDEKAVGDFLLCVMQGLRVMGRVAHQEDALIGIVDVAMRALV